MRKVSKNPLISVIVPVYNVEEYLKKCVDSIINQTYKNLEIILVDDGSTDNSSLICDTYAEKYEQIKVIHKKNGGLSDARNVGIDLAKGEYLTFIDSDDWIKEGFIEYLYNLNLSNNTMIAVAPYIVVTNSKQINCGNGYRNAVLEQKEALKRILLDQGYTVSSCSKLYHRSLFDNIKYPVGKIFEDTATTYKLFLKCESISFGSNGGYYYYKRDNSIINSGYNSKQLLFITYTDEMGEKILKKYPDLYEAVESKRLDARFSILRRLVLIKKPNDSEIETKDEIKTFILSRKKNIISGNYNRKIKIATLLLSISEKCFKLFWKIYLKCKYRK